MHSTQAISTYKCLNVWIEGMLIMPGGIEIYFLMQLLCSALCKLSFVERYKNICIIYVAAVFVYKPTQFQKMQKQRAISKWDFFDECQGISWTFCKINKWNTKKLHTNLIFYIPVLIFLRKNEVEVNIYSFKSRANVLHLAGF